MGAEKKNVPIIKKHLTRQIQRTRNTAPLICAVPRTLRARGTWPRAFPNSARCPPAALMRAVEQRSRADGPSARLRAEGPSAQLAATLG